MEQSLQVGMFEFGDSLPASKLGCRIRRSAFHELERGCLRVGTTGRFENRAVVGLALKITEGEPALNDVALPFFPRIIHEKSHQPAAEPRIFYFKRIGVLMQS
jgi:hypothetical protein